MSAPSFANFTLATARPFPVILVADTSGSMGQNGKIEALNLAVREMVDLFSRENGLRAELQVAVIVFGGDGARLHVPLTPARSLKWTDVTASGPTPLGAAIDMLRGLLEDANVVPSRAYRPAVVLLSDGRPNDEHRWPRAVTEYLGSDRASKATRFVVAIGTDADERPLRAFLGSESATIHRPETASELQELLYAVSQSICVSSRGVHPGENLDLDSP